MSDSAIIKVDFENPRNAGILRYFRGQGDSVSVAHIVPSCPPEAVDEPYIHLGTHPELVARLWDQITAALPVRCQYVVYGSPVLVRPDTGIIFAFAGGTQTYALRLAPKDRADMANTIYRRTAETADKLALHGARREKYFRVLSGDVHEYTVGSKLDLATIGPEWIFGRWLNDEIRWCESAFEYAVR